MYLKCEPWRGDFGFHKFNKQNYGTNLLPPAPLPYWNVGNINYLKKLPEAKKLPDSVKEHYNEGDHRTS